MDTARVKTGDGAATPSEKARAWIGVGLIVAAAAGAYANSFFGAFQFDDIPAILENPTLRHLWPPWIPLCPPQGALTVSGRPILNLSFAFNYAISGYNPWSYHALNLLIHIAVALTLFGIVRRTLARLWVPNREFSALAIALIWVVHPLTTESVTYIVQRAESLMALFYVLTLYCFIRSIDAAQPGSGVRWKALGVLFCWLGMGTKEVMVSVPIAVFLYDRIFVTRSWKAAWYTSRGFYLSLAAGWIPLFWLVADAGWDRGATAGFHVGVSWMGYWISQGEAVARYLGLAFWPYPLSIDYGPPSATAALAYAFVAVVLGAFIATAVACFRGRLWAYLAAVSFLILAPTSVMPGVLQFISEHRVYLPLAALVTAVVLGVQAATVHWKISPQARTLRMTALLVFVVAGLGTATARRNRVYADEYVLWMDTVAKRPKSALAQANVGKVLLERGHRDDAMSYCLEAVRLDPKKPIAHYNLGLAYEDAKRWDEALNEFGAAVNLNPNLYYAEFRIGRLLDRLGRWADAERILRLSLDKYADLAETHGSLGVALAGQGRQTEAIDEFERSLVLDPDQPELEFNLGVSLTGLGRIDEAVVHYSAAARLRPDYGAAQLNLGVSLARLGRFADALPVLQSAAQLMPDSPDAHGNLATLLDQLGRTDAAIAEYRSALQLRPGYAEAHYNFGNALIHAHDLVAARLEFAEALRLKPDFGAAREMLNRLATLPTVQ
jgi:tetratricopeptide (TPR) repeat protein